MGNQYYHCCYFGIVAFLPFLLTNPAGNLPLVVVVLLLLYRYLPCHSTKQS